MIHEGQGLESRIWECLNWFAYMHSLSDTGVLLFSRLLFWIQVYQLTVLRYQVKRLQPGPLLSFQHFKLRQLLISLYKERQRPDVCKQQNKIAF